MINFLNTDIIRICKSKTKKDYLKFINAQNQLTINQNKKNSYFKEQYKLVNYWNYGYDPEYYKQFTWILLPCMCVLFLKVSKVK